MTATVFLLLAVNWIGGGPHATAASRHNFRVEILEAQGRPGGEPDRGRDGQGRDKGGKEGDGAKDRCLAKPNLPWCRDKGGRDPGHKGGDRDGSGKGRDGDRQRQ
jgi:hypothetical protein